MNEFIDGLVKGLNNFMNTGQKIELECANCRSVFVAERDKQMYCRDCHKTFRPHNCTDWSE